MARRMIVPVLTFFGGLLMGGAVAAVAGMPPQAEEAREPLVVGIGGVFLKAQSPENLQDWYQRHLGIEPGPSGVQFLWRGPDEPSRIDRTVWSLFPRDTDYFGSSEQQFMVNYIVNDLDVVLSRLAEAGIPPVKDPEEYPYGRFAWVLDGEENRIELWEPPPSSPAGPPQEERMVGAYYTLGFWRVKQGREADFVDAWKSLGEAFAQLPDPPGPGVLLRSESDPALFYSFGPWARVEDIQAMRGDARSKAAIQRLLDLCTEATPGTFRVVAEAPGASIP